MNINCKKNSLWVYRLWRLNTEKFLQNCNHHNLMGLRKISLLSMLKRMHTINKIHEIWLVILNNYVHDAFIFLWVSFLRSSEWYVPSYYARIERNIGTGTKGLWRGSRTIRLLGDTRDDLSSMKGLAVTSGHCEGALCRVWDHYKSYSVNYLCRWYRSRYKLGVFVCTLLKVLIYNFTITARYFNLNLLDSEF